MNIEIIAGSALTVSLLAGCVSEKNAVHDQASHA